MGIFRCKADCRTSLQILKVNFLYCFCFLGFFYLATNLLSKLLKFQTKTISAEQKKNAKLHNLMDDVKYFTKTGD